MVIYFFKCIATLETERHVLSKKPWYLGPPKSFISVALGKNNRAAFALHSGVEMSSKSASSVSPVKALTFSPLTALSLALVFVMVSSVGLQAPALLDDSYAVYPTEGRDDWCEDQYEDDEQGCIADALCEPEYEDDGEFDDCEDVDEDDEDEDEGDYCDQYENSENGCIADSACDPDSVSYTHLTLPTKA